MGFWRRFRDAAFLSRHSLPEYHFCTVRGCTNEGTEEMRYEILDGIARDARTGMEGKLSGTIVRKICVDHYAALLAGVSVDWD